MKAVVILSGGLDSTCLLSGLRQGVWGSVEFIYALTFDYGQRHRREIGAATKICERLGIAHHVLPLGGLQTIFEGSSQTTDTIAVPEGHYEAENMKLTVVPNRNMVMLSLAAAFAISRGCDTVAYAAHAGDHAIYPDCRKAFVEVMTQALAICDWDPVNLLAPFLHMKKGELLLHGNRWGAPYELTYSCYQGRESHCGRCGTCIERKEAFEHAKIKDPTPYEP